MDSNRYSSTILALVVMLCSSFVLRTTTALPYDLGGIEGYNGEEGDTGFPVMDSLPEKRGMCRPGFTYQAILRDCMPSLGALRGRYRGRGRRGLSSWRY